MGNSLEQEGTENGYGCFVAILLGILIGIFFISIKDWDSGCQTEAECTQDDSYYDAMMERNGYY